MPLRDSGSSAVEIDFNLLEGLTGGNGSYVIHEIALYCPCQQANASEGSVGVADPTCPRCDGIGYLYRDPRQMYGLITGITLQKMLVEQGWAVPGDMIFAPTLHARRLATYDRVTLINPIPVDPQVITRGTVSTISPRPASLKSDEDFLFYEAGEKTATWIEDEDGVVYRPGQYSLSGRKIRWHFGPALGKKYTIKYEGLLEYIVWTTPMERLDRNRQLGQHVMLKKRVINATDVAKQITLPKIDQVLLNAFYSDKMSPRFFADGGKPSSEPQR